MTDAWKHRSASMTCAGCMWYVPKVVRVKSVVDGEPRLDDHDTKIGRCRRHAPTMNGYPVVYVSDWCGDHRVDENKAVQQSVSLTETGGIQEILNRLNGGSK